MITQTPNGTKTRGLNQCPDCNGFIKAGTYLCQRCATLRMVRLSLEAEQKISRAWRKSTFLLAVALILLSLSRLLK